MLCAVLTTVDWPIGWSANASIPQGQILYIMRQPAEGSMPLSKFLRTVCWFWRLCDSFSQRFDIQLNGLFRAWQPWTGSAMLQQGRWAWQKEAYQKIFLSLPRLIIELRMSFSGNGNDLRTLSAYSARKHSTVV